MKKTKEMSFNLNIKKIIIIIFFFFFFFQKIIIFSFL